MTTVHLPIVRIEIKPAWLVESDKITQGFGFELTYIDFVSKTKAKFFTPSLERPVWKKIQYGEDLEFSEGEAERRQIDVVEELLRLYKNSLDRDSKKVNELEAKLKELKA